MKPKIGYETFYMNILKYGGHLKAVAYAYIYKRLVAVVLSLLHTISELLTICGAYKRIYKVTYKNKETCRWEGRERERERVRKSHVYLF
jgi:hypothetical protein